MKLPVTRLPIRLQPDVKKVIPRFFNTGDVRARTLIDRVLELPEQQATTLLQHVFDEFGSRYHDLVAIFEKHVKLVAHLLPAAGDTPISHQKKLLIGAYFTMEYSLEHAALFNPSIVPAPDQSGTSPGETRVILSFRATGEGHISSLVFKQALLDKEANIHFDPPGTFLYEGSIVQPNRNNKTTFGSLPDLSILPQTTREQLLEKLNDTFTYQEIEKPMKAALMNMPEATPKNKLLYDILSKVNTSYELSFPPVSQLSERVIFPNTFTEKNGIEDARFTRFSHDDGTHTYLATYTAYDGTFILPHLIETTDFLHFRMSPLHGQAAINKNLAIFPRKVNGRYAMISRIDGVNNYIMYSDDLYLWETATVLQTPLHPWEFVQIGNAGSPIETSMGWLIITHGVGPMRKYCLGASLYDLNDPEKELGRLKEPLLVPEEDERYGYVPNVVYSCGAMVHHDKLFLPYAVSDYATSFATIPLQLLLEEILRDS